MATIVRGLLVSHRGKRCGVYQFGVRLFRALSSGHDIEWHYVECDSLDELLRAEAVVRPDFVLLNYHPGTLEWAATEELGRVKAVTFSVFHEAHQATADQLSPKPFQYLLCPDPTLLARNPIALPVPRFIPSPLEDIGPPPDVMTIGSFGFATPGKGFDRLCELVNAQFDNALIRINIPPHDNAAMVPREWVDAMVASCQSKISKPGIRLEITHDFLDEPELLAFLSQNTINAFLYDDVAERGLSSCTDYALASGRPIAISQSPMFRHLHGLNPSICVEDRTLAEIADSSTAILRQCRAAYAPGAAGATWNRAILDALASRALSQSVPDRRGFNKLLDDRSRNTYQAALADLSRYAPEMLARKIERANIQQAFALDTAERLAGRISTPRMLAIGSFEDTAVATLRAKGFRIDEVDPNVNQLDLDTFYGCSDVVLGSYDLILCVSVLEHVADDRGFVRMTADLLAPRGVAVFTVDFSNHYSDEGRKPAVDVRLYTTEDVQCRLMSAIPDCGLLDAPSWNDGDVDFDYDGCRYSFASWVFRKLEMPDIPCRASDPRCDPYWKEQLRLAKLRLGETTAAHAVLSRELDQTRGELDQTRNKLDQARGELDQARGELDQTRGELDQRSRQRARLAAELKAVSGSFWWRVSVPFRKPPASLAVLAAEMASDREFGADGACPPIAGSLDELLTHDGEAFVRCAYATLLGRGAEPEGLRYFLGRLMLGSSRETIAAELSTSAEGRRFGAKLPGLDGLVRRYRLLNTPITGPLFRLLGVTAKSRRAFWFLPPGPITGAGTGRIASSVEELLSLHDEAFVRCAYATVLGRDPDPDGLRHHLALIRNGESRRAILAGIRLSAEGRRRETSLPGLDQAIRCYRWQRLPLLGPILRLAGVCHDRVDVPRKLATIETQLDLLVRLAPSPDAAGHADEQQVHEATPSTPPPSEVGKAERTTTEGSNAKSSETVVWSSPLTWRVKGISDEAEELSLTRVEMARALSELGHDVASASPSVAADVTALVASPPLPTDTSNGSTLLVGHDWEESGYPAHWVDGFNASLCGVACASNHTLKVLVDHGVGVPVAAVGLGVDHWERIFARPDYRAPGKRFRFLHVSSCGPGKGIDLLLESFGRVFGSDDDASLIVKPSGAPPRELFTLLDRLRKGNPRFPDVVLIEDNLTDAELKALYGQCQVFLAPSRAEGFGLPIAQALLTGLPIVATAWGGHRDYCDETNSWLVDYRFQRARTPNDLIASAWVEPTANSLDEALWMAYRAAPAERFAKSWSGRKRLIERFTWKHAALRLAALAEAGKAEAAVEPGKSRVGWVTTWNVKCGIAGHVGHLLASIPTNEFVVFAARQEPRLRPDEPNCLRTWNMGKDANGLDEIAGELARWSVSALVIHFNYGFFNHFELNDFIESALAKGIVVLVDFHSTVDPFGETENFRLADCLRALRKCHRLLAHGPADMDRLKALGLVDNVMLLPLGAMNKGHELTVPVKHNNPPLIASFGFCFPVKGLLELVQAVDLLRREGRPVRLRMLNAEYPTPESAAMTQRIKEAIEELGLQDEVETHTEFLEDEVCLALLSEADLVVNPYQRTGESASAAVRYGLSAGRPVAVTPLLIFDDLGDAVFRMPGTTPHDIAQGIASALGHLKEESETASRVRSAARRWLEAHDCSRQGARLMRTARALARREAAIRTAEGPHEQQDSRADFHRRTV